MSTIVNPNETLPENLVLWIKHLGPCGQCGCDEVATYTNPDGLWGICPGMGGLCSQIVFSPPDLYILTNGVKIGTIEGRHNMPVKRYLFDENSTKRYGFHNQIYHEALCKGQDLAQEMIQIVHLYPTGLTPVTLGAVAGMKSVGIKVVIMNHDAATGNYIPIPV